MKENYNEIYLKYGLKAFFRLHRRYHHTNSCDDLVSLAFDIGHELGYYSLMLSSEDADKNIREKFDGLYYHLRFMCEHKAFKIFNND